MLGAETYLALTFGITATLAVSYFFYRLLLSGFVEPYSIVASAATGFVVAMVVYGWPASAHYYAALAGATIAVVSSMLASFYIRKPGLFAGLVAVLIVMLATYYSLAGEFVTAIAMFAIGTAYGFVPRDREAGDHRGKARGGGRKDVEVNRDIVQMALGLIVALAVLLLGLPEGAYAVFGLILLGYLMNNMLVYDRMRSAYAKVMRLERESAVFGIGAVYLAIGTSFLLGFVGNEGFVLFGVMALFFADSVATILGVSVRSPRLPYNPSKSLSGTLAFFLVLAVSGYFLIGAYALPFAAVLAFSESLPLGIDDNVQIGVTLIALYALFSLLPAAI